MKNSKIWSIALLVLTLALLGCAAAATAVIDPYFHYHAPAEGLSYPINNQRYQNDGIVKQFSYDALITGTSMMENFKTSEFDEIFGVNSVKVCFSGGTYEEITGNLHRALEANPGIRYVIYGLDEWLLYAGKDLILADGAYPTYLYDSNPFNDVQYVFNKEILCGSTLEVLFHTRAGLPTTSFDDYSSWDFPTGAQVLLEKYQRPEQAEEETKFTKGMAKALRDNLRTNMVALAQEHPDTQFLYVFPPYSILTWDEHVRKGILNQSIDAMKVATETLLEADNIQVYAFYTDHELICDPEHYRDMVHYDSSVNSLLLQRMGRGEYRLTEEGFADYWEEIREFYSSFDYDALLAQWREQAQMQ